MASCVLDAGYKLGGEPDLVPVLMELSINCTGREGPQQMYVQLKCTNCVERMKAVDSRCHEKK